MNPQLHYDMLEALTELEVDKETQVLVLTGAGPSWCAGQDLREYFRGTDNNALERRKASWASQEWRWRRLFYFPKPTIAMVNGFCFGGAFTPLIACDFAIAAEDATFGLSEINWGIFPGGLVSRVLADAMCYRDAMWYIMTGDPFDGKRAAEVKLVNFAVPKDKLREETMKLADKLKKKNPRCCALPRKSTNTAAPWTTARPKNTCRPRARRFVSPTRKRAARPAWSSSSTRRPTVRAWASTSGTRSS